MANRDLVNEIVYATTSTYKILNINDANYDSILERNITKNDNDLIQLSILNRWISNSHILEYVELTLNNKFVKIYLLDVIDDFDIKRTVSLFVDVEHHGDLANFIHCLYENEYSFIVKTENELIQSVVFNGIIQERAAQLTCDCVNQPINNICKTNVDVLLQNPDIYHKWHNEKCKIKSFKYGKFVYHLVSLFFMRPLSRCESPSSDSA